MIPSVKIEDDRVGIPIYMKNEFAWFFWKEEESFDDFIKINSMHSYGGLWCNFCVWGKNDEGASLGTFDCHVYDLKDIEKNEYHLITYGEISDFEDIKNSVCLPFNRLNLLTFYKEFFLDFSDKDIFHG